MQEDVYFLGFSLFPGIGSVTLEKLIGAFESAKNAWQTEEKDLEQILGKKKTDAFLVFRKSISLDEEWEKLNKKEITFLSQNNPQFPKLLKKLPHPPIGIYVKGDVNVFFHEKSIGIVGTRKISPYGKQVTDMLTREFVAQGFVIVSGLALGVDGVAHQTSLDCHGRTIAVLGSGVDICVPSSHQYLYDKIISNKGAIVSTFPPEHVSSKGLFPARNALIAGLSLGIVVTEGAIDSGALITAEYAKKMGRPIFAVPGPITSSLSKAPLTLLGKGAFPIASAADALDKLGILETPKKEGEARDVAPEEAAILSLLQNGPLHFDEIVRRIKGDSKNIGSLLSLMELKGLLVNSNGAYSI